ncbi:MAG TPA: hypothetical protein VHO69_11490 [Phototrophicaceae bacterium]|nr:hypothetical protein [Phototrophicaceae bacterium]
MSQTRIRPWLIVTVLCLLYVMIIILRHGDPLALVTLGTRFSDHDPTGSEGYDGQFVYYIARDPATAASIIDVPAYRFQRILLPILGRLLALGQEALLPWTLLVVNLVSLAVGAALLEHLLTTLKISRWYALTYGLTIGIFGAVRLTLPEPLAYALVIGGIVLARRDRWLPSAALFALAAIARETTLLFPFGYGLYLLSRRQIKIAFSFALISLLPFAVWQIVLYQHFGTFGIGSGGALATPFEIIPFAGIARILTDAPPEARFGLLAIFSAVLIPFVLVPTLWALWRGWRDWPHWSAYNFVLFTNAFVMPFVPFSTYREPLAILRFIVGLQIALILYAAEKHQPRALRNSTIWILTVMFGVSLL